MRKNLVNLTKSMLSSAGLFVARQYPGVVNGYALEKDLAVLLTKENPVCFDVGANYGQTIQLLQRALPNPIVHAFEPASATFASLSNQSFGPRVQLHQLAFGECAGVAEFRNYKQSDLSSFLAMHPDKAENIFAEEELESVESVAVATVDDFCATHHIDHIDLLKIDTQGFEMPVLRGTAGLLGAQRIGAVLLELNFSTLYEGQSDPLEILHLLRTQQMRLVGYYENERAKGRELSWTTALFMHYA